MRHLVLQRAEALSFGVPVIVSDTVGAQDILQDKFGIVVKKIPNKKEFKRSIRQTDF